MNALLFAADAGFPRGPGFYFSIVKLVLLLIVFLGWVKACAWVNEDANRQRLPTDLWNGMTIGSGVVGFFVVWLLPAFYFSIFLLIVLVLTPVLAYIYQRDLRVSDKKKILPASFYRSVGAKARKASNEPTLIRFIDRRVGRKKLKGGPDTPEHRAVLVLVYNAVFQQATEIHLQPGESALTVRYRVGGGLQAVDPLPRPAGDEVVGLLQSLADVGESGRGRVTVEADGRLIDLNVTASGRGAMSIRIVDRARKVPELEQLGLLKDHFEKLCTLIESPRGLLLFGSPPGCGRTTTLCACLAAVPRIKKKVVLLVEQLEMPVPNTTMIELGGDAPKDFMTELKGAVRGGANVIGLGDVATAEAAQAACQLAGKERLVLAAVSANDAVTALMRPIEVGGPPALLAGAAVAVLAQRLVRKLCEQCRVAYKPNPDLLRQANLPSDKVQDFYRAPEPTEPGAACDACGGAGYVGHIAIFELLVLNDVIRKLIREKAAVDVIREEVEKLGGRTMQEDGLIKVVQGVTSVQELLRVCG